MIEALAWLLSFQLAGETLVVLLDVPLPGPVIGLTLMAAALALRPDLLARLRTTAMTLLQHLSLLFVPAGVGVMVHAERLAREGVAVMIAIVVSTVLAIVVTALTVHLLRRRPVPREERE